MRGAREQLERRHHRQRDHLGRASFESQALPLRRFERDPKGVPPSASRDTHKDQLSIAENQAFLAVREDNERLSGDRGIPWLVILTILAHPPPAFSEWRS